jgi:hypothetical protein
MKNILQAYRPSYLWFSPPLILGGSVISAGTIHDLRRVKVPGTGPLWNPCLIKIQKNRNCEILLYIIQQSTECWYPSDKSSVMKKWLYKRGGLSWGVQSEILYTQSYMVDMLFSYLVGWSTKKYDTHTSLDT